MRWRRCGVRSSTSPPRRRLRDAGRCLVPEDLLAQVERGRRLQAGIGRPVPGIAVAAYLEVREPVMATREHGDRAAHEVQDPMPGALHRPVGRRAAPRRAALPRRLELDEQDRRLACGPEARGADQDERTVADTRRVAKVRGGELARVPIKQCAWRWVKRNGRGRRSDEQRHEQEQGAAGHGAAL